MKRHFGLLHTAFAVIRSFRWAHKVWIAPAVRKPSCESISEPPCAVELLLFLGVMHFCIEINLGNFERFVTEPTLDFHQVEARAQPVRNRSLAKPVEIAFLTRGLGDG